MSLSWVCCQLFCPCFLTLERMTTSKWRQLAAYAMSGNGRDPYTSGSVRMDSGDDACNPFPRDSRPKPCRPSFTGRFTSAPSVANTPNEPTLTRTTGRRGEATRPSKPILATDTSSKRSQGPLKSGFYIPGSSSRSSRKQVRFTRSPCKSEYKNRQITTDNDFTLLRTRCVCQCLQYSALTHLNPALRCNGSVTVCPRPQIWNGLPCPPKHLTGSLRTTFELPENVSGSTLYSKEHFRTCREVLCTARNTLDPSSPKVRSPLYSSFHSQ